MFEYCDKIGKQIARVLAENPTTVQGIGMRKEKRELTILPLERLENLAKYYFNLYTSSNPSYFECKKFLDQIEVWADPF